MTDPVDARLVGPLSIDCYVDSGDRLPGGGALNTAYHWSRAGLAVEIVSRLASDGHELFEAFLTRHRIGATPELVAGGQACTIEIRFGPDRQPDMGNFVEGVLADFSLSDAEVSRITDGTPAHFVLVDVVDRELLRLAGATALRASRLSGDFLSFRHFTIERFAATCPYLDVGFVGWPGAPTDAIIETLGDLATDAGTVLVVTFGSEGVRVIDGRTRRRNDVWFDVDARAVTGTTVGCGDAFIAAFLTEWFQHQDIASSVDAGRELGAAATSWSRPLPNIAYG